MKHLLGAEARRAIGAVVRDIESRTAAEIVVTVRARAAAYRHADFAFGALCALAALGVYVYAPITFADDTAPLAIAACFLGGALLAAALDPLKRLFTRRGARREAVRLGARAAFFDQRVGSTRARSGVLVFVSVFEREVEVLPDIGIDVGAMGERWQKAVADLEAAVRDGGALDQLERALRGLGDELAEAMPIGADDVNELPDEVAS